MLVVLAAALWGTSGVATKTIYTLVDISPITVAAFRLALGAPLLLAAFRLTSGQRSFRVARTDLAWMLLAGAAGDVASLLFCGHRAGGRGHRHAGDDMHRARPGVSLLGGAAAGAAGNTLPYVTGWYEKYRGQGLVVSPARGSIWEMIRYHRDG